MSRSHINAATSDGGARREAYEAAATKAGLTLSQWVLQTLDAKLTATARKALPPLAKNGEKGRKKASA